MWFVYVMVCEHFLKFCSVIQRSQKKFFHIKSVYYVSKFMLISEKTCRNLTDLDSFPGFPEELHGKRSVFLTGLFYIGLQKFCGRSLYLCHKPGRIDISCTDGNFAFCNRCFFTVCNTDHMNLSIQDPGHHIKFISIVIFFHQDLRHIRKFCCFL